MKTTFKKTLAAVSAAAVVAASAVVMSVPASAAGSISIGSATIAYEDLEDGQVVEVEVTSSGSTELAFGVSLCEGLSFSGKGYSTDAAVAAFPSGSTMNWYAATDSDGYAGSVTLLIAIDKSVVDAAVDAASGVTDSNTIVLPITGYSTAADGSSAIVDGEDATVSSGSVIITLPEEEEETTAATTEAAEEETTTTTTATVTTSTGSPKTGESSALPIAGVVVAVAVIGGVAVVSKKRK